MDKGKFSQPRPYRDEERQIEEAFKQLTEQKHPFRKPTQPADDADFRVEEPVSDETMALPIQPSPASPEEAAEPDIPLFDPPADPRSSIEDVISQEILKNYPEDPPEPEAFPQEEPEYEEEEPSYGDGFREYLSTLLRENKKSVILGLCTLVMLIVMVGFGIGFFSGISGSGTGDRIAENVMIVGVNVGGMSKSEAVRAVKEAIADTYAVQDMVVEIGDTTLKLSPKDTKASLDVKAAVDKAFALSQEGAVPKEGCTIDLQPYLKLDTDFIRKELNRHAQANGSTLTEASYGLEGKYPALSAANFDANAAQTLVLTMGTPGVSFDVDGVYNQILDAYSLHSFHVIAEGLLPSMEPKPVDLMAIYREVYVAPKNSTLDNQTYEMIPGSYGYEFDLEAAQKKVDAAGYGEVIRIPMIFIAPERLDENILFRDVLGEGQTRLSGSNERIGNIRLACEAMNGVILQPGEAFSYNDCLGPRTAEKGYQLAPAYSGNTLVDSLGGGICQGSTTLYYAALLADMEIVSRVNHGFPVSYIDFGMDATVSWGGPDFKFRNNTNYPVKILASVSGNYLTIQLLGTEQRDYTVKMEYTITSVLEPSTEYREFPFDNPEGYADGDVIQEGVKGYAVKTYKLKYSRSTGKLISRDFEANSRYTTLNQIIAKVEPPEETQPEPTVPETTVPEITVPETTQPPEPTVPETVVPPLPTAPEIPPESQSEVEEAPEYIPPLKNAQ